MSKPDSNPDYKATINLPATDFPMKAGLPVLEPKILQKWQDMDAYHRLQKDRADAHSYVLHDGPPYANGDIHIGHAVNKILKDMIVKSRNLKGLRAPYVPGWDCHGLPIEIQVEKKFGKVGVKIDKKTFKEKCREYAGKQIEKQKKDFIRLGVQGDWQNPYLTMDYRTEAEIIRSLAKIVESGHLFHGLMPVYWCPACGSALAEAEVEYQDKISPAIDVGFKLVDNTEFYQKIGSNQNSKEPVEIVIWTTTPWTMPANEAVAVHAELDYLLIESGTRRLIFSR